MRTRRTYRTALAIAAFVAIAAALSGDLNANERHVVVVIVSPKSRVTNISMDDLRRLYTGRPQTISGQRLIPLNLSTSDATRRRFDDRVLEMSAAQAARFWTDKRIRGGAMPPKEPGTDKRVLMTVARYPTVIGYLPADAISPSVADRVRILTVDGKSPSHPDYPLVFE